MNSQKTLFLTLITLSLIFSGCFSPWAGGEQGTITISIGGNGQARGTWSKYDTDNFLHIVTITGPGQEQEQRFFCSGEASFIVATGRWHIDVKAYDKPDDISNSVENIIITNDDNPVAVGEGNVYVKAGNNFVSITMGPPSETPEPPTPPAEDNEYTLTVGVIRGQDSKTLTKEKWGSVEIVNPKRTDNNTSSNGNNFSWKMPNILENTSVTIKATPNAECVFVEWRTEYNYEKGQTEGKDQATYSFNIKGNTTLYAVFKKTNTILIKSESEMAKIGKDYNYPMDGNYVLIADLDFSSFDNWEPIGKMGVDGSTFAGTFDGMGHSISLDNIEVSKVQCSNGDCAGLFGVIDSEGIVKNLRLEGTITFSESEAIYFYVGAVAGENWGTIKNIVSSVIIQNNGVANTYAGGIAGINIGTIENCASIGQIGNPNTDSNFIIRAGGIVGQNPDGKINNCWASGEITASLDNGYAGGIAGSINNPGSIKNCVAVNAKITGFKKGRIAYTGTSGVELKNNYANVSGFELSGGGTGQDTIHGETVDDYTDIEGFWKKLDKWDNSIPWAIATPDNASEITPWINGNYTYGNQTVTVPLKLWFNNN
jgi:hypothetical protein